MGRTSVAEPDADFAAFYMRTYGHVWGILGRAGVTRSAERQELAQEVYLVAHTKLATRDPAVPELAWIGAIAWNFARRYRALARTQREQPMDDVEALGEAEAGGPTPEEFVGQRRRYLDIVEGMSFDCRVVFEMHEVDGFSLPEIAATLGVPLGTATTRLRRARRDATAAASRMEAREAHVESRPAGLPLVVPFGAGAWAHVGKLFDDAPAGAEQQGWRGVCRAIARAAAVGAADVAGAAAAKVAAGTVFGSGFLFGGAAVGGAMYLLRVFAGAPAAPPSIARAPANEAVSITMAPAVVTTASAAGVEGGASPTAAPRLPALATPTARVGGAGATAQPMPAGIDPEEERILARAQAAFVRGNPEAARAALDDHARRFPAGRAKLGAESAALRAKLADVGSTPAPPTPDAGPARHHLFGSDD